MRGISSYLSFYNAITLVIAHFHIVFDTDGYSKMIRSSKLNLASSPYLFKFEITILHCLDDVVS